MVGSEEGCRGDEPDQDENRAGTDGGIIEKYIIQIVYLYKQAAAPLIRPSRFAVGMYTRAGP